jgi:acyl-CoA dehydrogenase
MQAFGAEGLSQDQELAFMFANLRTLRIADVSSEFYPNYTHADLSLSFRALTRCVVHHSEMVFLADYSSSQVHIQQVGQRELKRAPALAKKAAETKKREAALFERYGLKLPQ